MVWTAEREQLLEKLWIEGLSASQIAYVMSGCTRNAVIGKAHRLGLPRRAAAPAGQAARNGKGAGLSLAPLDHAGTCAALPHAAAASPPPGPVATGGISLPAEPQGEAADALQMDVPPGDQHDMIKIMTLRKHCCKWPIGDPVKNDFRFCNEPAQPGKSYCAHHQAIAYQPGRPATVANDWDWPKSDVA